MYIIDPYNTLRIVGLELIFYRSISTYIRQINQHSSVTDKSTLIFYRSISTHSLQIHQHSFFTGQSALIFYRSISTHSLQIGQHSYFTDPPALPEWFRAGLRTSATRTNGLLPSFRVPHRHPRSKKNIISKNKMTWGKLGRPALKKPHWSLKMS